MANFTVRVELHQAVGTDYDALHAAMEQQGFSRFITGDNGQTYHMPWAEYNGSGYLTSVRVRDIARTAANTTGKGNAVLVTESATRAWIGLSAVAS
jgi:hypothetical protein